MEGPTLRGGAVYRTGLGVEDAVKLKLFHHHHSQVMRENVKTSENAQCPRGSVESHTRSRKGRALGDTKLSR